jgi:queuine tRNA-ribosyltransferase
MAASSLTFCVKDRDPAGKARAGVLHTAHGEALTPTFMPVGTRGSVKAMGPDDLEAVGTQIVLANTYHLLLRPGPELIKSLGGLHRFMDWPGPILTDSGGYQVFSLAGLRKLSEEGVAFQSHIDGQNVFLSPEKAVAIQEDLGVDIMMCLDECTPYPANRETVETSMALTYRWARRSLEVRSGRPGPGGAVSALFGIVQGGTYGDLRQRAADEIGSLPFDGIALGGLALGEPMAQRLDMIAAAVERLDEKRPLYLMGLGTPEDIVEGMALGADMFDCVLPTRNARNGQFFTNTGRLVIKNARFRDDGRPVEEGCGCYTCRRFRRAYLRHLYTNGELLAYRLNTIHNLYYYLSLTARARQAVVDGTFTEFYREFYGNREYDGE